MSPIKNKMDFTNDENLIKEVIEMAEYTIENESTVRKTAKEFGISKSTVYNRLTLMLKYINFDLYDRVQKIMQKNKEERSLRGGQATKDKYNSK